ncbi:MAG: hypothetical protein WB800_34390, partial [Streptosporangiaceae bacterium]
MLPRVQGGEPGASRVGLSEAELQGRHGLVTVVSAHHDLADVRSAARRGEDDRASGPAGQAESYRAEPQAAELPATGAAGSDREERRL